MKANSQKQRCLALRNDNRRQRIIAEQQLIGKFDTVQNGLNKDYAFMSHYIANY